MYECISKDLSHSRFAFVGKLLDALSKVGWHALERLNVVFLLANFTIQIIGKSWENIQEGYGSRF